MQKTHNQFVFEMQSKNSNITILGKYIKSTVKIKCRCNVCNYEFEARPNDLLNGHGCPQCKRIKLSEMYKHSHEDFLQKISDKNINVNIISTYKGSHKNVHCLCNICNKEFDILANNLLKHGCPICGVKRRVIMRTKSHEDFLVEMNKQNKKIKIIGKYINAKEPIECMCEICNNKWFATPDSLLNGTGCPNCKIYKGEKQILDYLESHEVIFERQKTYNDLIGIGGKKLSYDFYLPTKRLFIEYNGEQHYIPIDFFGGQDKFNIQQEHDKRKEEYAHKMDIKLLIIPYWNFDNIENILEKALKEVRNVDGKNAKRSDDITDEMWSEVLEFNRNMVQEYLDNQTELAAKSKIAYKSGLRIFFYWVKQNLNNKSFLEIKKKEYVRYLNWITNRGLSDSAIKFKKSSVSSFCNYVMMMYEEEYPTFRNFTVGLKVVKTGNVYPKEPLTPDEYIMLCEELEKREEWQKLAYLVFTYSTGCRRAESRQLLKEVIDYPAKERKIKIVDEDGNEKEAISKSYQTHIIRCKGASVVGKPRKLKFGEDAMSWMKKWLEVRGEDDCPYMFVVKYKNGKTRQVGEDTFNGWCEKLFAKIIGRRCHPHQFRESRATNLVVYEHKSAEVAQKLLGHNDVSTTKNHYIIRNDEIDESDEAFV